MLVSFLRLTAISLCLAASAAGGDDSVSAAIATADGAPRSWEYIVVHHSATERGSVEAIDRSHKARLDSDGKPWLGIGYHFVIGNGNGMADGEVASTFRWKDQISGAHAGSKLYNECGVGVCLIGNFENNPPTSKQRAALDALIEQLRAKCDIAPANIVAHGDIRQTACPGKLFPREQFLTAQLHTTRRFPFDEPGTSEPSCDDAVQTAENSSNWKESR